MSGNKDASKSDPAPTFHGNPVFNGTVLFNSVWNANEAGERTSFESEKKLLAIAEDKFEDELDANVEECSPTEYEVHKTINDVYRIKEHPKGRILILNNEFKDSKIKRRGNQKDVSNMMVLWQSLGFAVEIVSDLTSHGMQREVREFVQSESMRRVDICAIMVMSHGEKDDFIIGESNTKTNVQNLVDIVAKSDKLRDKPKLLFFQMCRGSKAERHSATTIKASRIQSDSVPIANDAEQSDISWLRNVLSDLLPKSSQEKQRRLPGPQPRRNFGPKICADSISGVRRVESDATAFEYAEQAHDIFIAFATQPDHVSFRGEEGSWFVKAIANQFKAHAKDKDLGELMTLVKDEVSKRRSYAPTKNPKYHDCGAAVEASDSFFGRKLYFFPGFPNPGK